METGSFGNIQSALGWVMPGPGGILTFLIRIFFIVAGLAALFQLMMGALGVIVSGGVKEKWDAAFRRMSSALIGVFLIIVILSVLVVLERQVFRCHICFGLSCPLHIPSLMEQEAPPPACV